MLDAAQQARSFVDGRSIADLRSNAMLSLALIRLIEIFGEAATRVSGPVQAAHSEIPWRQIAGARNRLIHGYFNVDLNVIWAIIQDDLPPLIEQLERLLQEAHKGRTHGPAS
jgi:uncharacterized protein with HEPN domain